MAKTSVAHTDVDICNLALVQDGANLIITLADRDTSDEAKLCRQLYPLVRDICLTDWEWNGPSKFATLGNAISGTESADWEFVFNLPADCLQVIAQVDEGSRRRKPPYEVLGRQLFTNDLSNSDGDSAYIKYISVADVSKISPQVIEYIALKLALMMGPKLLGVSDASSIIMQTMEKQLRLSVFPKAVGRNQAEGDEAGGNDEGEFSWAKGRSRGVTTGFGDDCCGGFPCRG